MSKRIAISALALTLITHSALADDPPAPPPADLDAYLECEAIASHRLLPPNIAAICSQAFMRVKLSFLPNTDQMAYSKLAPKERAQTNARGYAAYLKWRDDNAKLIARMSADAVRRVSAGR
jgi:hypothetical protein